MEEIYKKYSILEVETKTYNNKECIVIRDRENYCNEIWIDKETSTIAKTASIDKKVEKSVNNYTIEIGNVKDEDIKMPSTTGYEIDDFAQFLLEDYFDM